MIRLFPRWSDTALRIALVVLASGAVLTPVALMLYVRTPYNQGRQLVVEQPVQFDHRHHVQDDGIACLYCHIDAERSASAGVPSTEICMGCHSQIWPDSPKLAPVRASFFTNQPIRWNRVHDLADFVQFDHSVHVTAGVSCARCHGDVERMPLVHKERPLTMQFCLECHREPEAQLAGYVRPLDRAEPPHGSGYVDDTLLSCTACHR
jgi:Cytochrome c3